MGGGDDGDVENHSMGAGSAADEFSIARGGRCVADLRGDPVGGAAENACRGGELGSDGGVDGVSGAYCECAGGAENSDWRRDLRAVTKTNSGKRRQQGQRESAGNAVYAIGSLTGGEVYVQKR